MARPLRIEFPGAVYHVTSRGNARAPIFLGDADQHLFLDTLGAVVEQHGWLCRAYCLMTNHYHLLLETPGANLSRGMRELNGVYAQCFNRRNNRVGHVFQGRFAGILVQRESHLLELARYIVLNPLRAGMVHAAEDYRWSSLRATLGLARAPAWLAHETLLETFGSAARYGAFIREGIGAGSPWEKLRGSLLGSEQFAARMCEHLGERRAQREVPLRQRLVHREPLDQLFPPQVVVDRSLRNERIREVRRSRNYTLTELAGHLGLHYGTVSRIATAGR
jgi:putative transposase